MTDLTLGGNSSFASAINHRGQVIGFSSTATGEHHAFLWDHGVMIDLGPLVANPFAVSDINNRRQVVGMSNNHGVLWRKHRAH